MSFISRVNKTYNAAINFMATTATSISDLLSPRKWLVEALRGMKTLSGIDVNPSSAMTLSVYFACLSCISVDCAKLPLKVYGKIEINGGQGKEELPDHPVYKLLQNPNEEMTGINFREAFFSHAIGWGNAYAEIEWSVGGDPIALWLIHPSRVTVKRDELGQIYYEILNNNLGAAKISPTRLRPRDVLHFHGLGYDGLTGFSPARLGAETIGLALAAQTFGSTFFQNGANVGGLLSHPGTLSEPAQKRIRKTWQETYAGAHNAHNVAIAEEGMTYTKTSIPPEEAQFLETRQFQIEEICRWFRVPPHKVQHLLRATFSNIEHQAIEYVVDTLMPWAVRFEQELFRKLIPLKEQGRLCIEHNFNGLLRGDNVARAAFYTSQFQVGALNTNEIRALENRNPIKGGDKHVVQVNLTTLDKVGEQPAAAPSGTGGGVGGKQPNPPDSNKEKVDFRPIIASACERICLRESKALSRAIVKYKGNAEHFEQWLNGFLEQERKILVKNLEAIYLQMEAPELPLEIISELWTETLRHEGNYFFTSPNVQGGVLVHSEKLVELIDPL